MAVGSENSDPKSGSAECLWQSVYKGGAGEPVVYVASMLADVITLLRSECSECSEACPSCSITMDNILPGPGTRV